MLQDVLPITTIKKEGWVLVGLSNNSLVMIEKLNKLLNCNYDRLFIEPVYAPNNNECEIAMISETDEIVMHERLIESFEIKKDYVYGEAHRKHEDDILREIYKMRKGESFINVKDQHVLLIDLGNETGLSILTSIKSLFKLGASNISIALPVIAKDIYDELLSIVDDIYTLHILDNYISAYFYYKDVIDLSNEEVEKILEKRNHGDATKVRVQQK